MRLLRLLGLTLVLLSFGAVPAEAQILSPGKLSAPHAGLEGLRQCTQCHQLGQRGVTASLCVGCHTTLGERIAAKRGFHATVSSECATCHKEHLGVDFALVRLDTAKFEHERSTGYALTGGHAGTECRSCHTAEHVADPAVRRYGDEHRSLDRTFLGLPSACVSCHLGDDPHGRQFAGRACTDCHTTESWKDAPLFAHDRTRFRLTGRHLQAGCADCHARTGPVVFASATSSDPARAAAESRTAAADRMTFRPLEFAACTSCHQDPHEGAMRGRCETCHTTAGWERLDRGALEKRFDHRSTGFQLTGKHAELGCASCHDARAAGRLDGIRIQFVASTARRQYPQPRTGGCVACHTDAHDGAFATSPGGGDCAGCHGERSWLPAQYDLVRHDRDVHFALQGAHRAVACADCHRVGGAPLALHPPSGACTDCHAADDPHQGQFAGRACSTCHVQETFRIAGFDHGGTRFPLDGTHRDVPCASCHKAARSPAGTEYVRYSGLGRACRDCHEAGA